MILVLNYVKHIQVPIITALALRAMILLESLPLQFEKKKIV